MKQFTEKIVTKGLENLRVITLVVLSFMVLDRKSTRLNSSHTS